MNDQIKLNGLSCDINNDEIEDLKLYKLRVQSIKSSNFFNFLLNNKKLSYKLSFKKGESVQFQSVIPSEEAIKAFMMDFSHIYLTRKQPANFNHICNILQQKLINQKLKNSVLKCRNLYKDALKKNPLVIKYNQKTFLPEDIIKQWIMGAYRHDDKNYRKIISDWERMSGSYYKFTFLDIITKLLYPVIIVNKDRKSVV